MSYSTLLGTWQVVSPHISGTLIGPQQRAAIAGYASILPSVTECLLEFRLQQHDTQVDLSQAYTLDELPSLVQCISAWKTADARWESPGQIIESFLAKNSIAADVRDATIDQVGLEADIVPSRLDDIPPPNVFFRLSKRTQQFAADSAVSELILQTLRPTITGNQIDDYSNLVEKCLKVRPAGTQLNYLGLMSARDPTNVRLQLSNFNLTDISAFLAEMGLNTEQGHSCLTEAIHSASLFFEKCVLSLDLTRQIEQRIGIELFPSQLHAKITSRDFLDYLVTQNYCSREKHLGLTAWSGASTPGNTATAWPEHMIMQSLLKPENLLEQITRRINHFKFICEPGSRVRAKAYLSFRHEWINCTR